MTERFTEANRRRDVRAIWGRNHRITPAERDRIIDLLTKLPIPEVKARTGRTYSTLARIADAAGV